MASKSTIKTGMYQAGGMRSQHMDVAAATTMWNQLNAAIDAIFWQKTSTLSFNELYNYGYQLSIHKHGELLYNGVAGAVKGHLLNSLKDTEGSSNESMLQVMKKTWEEFKVTSGNIRDILMYLDRTHVTQFKKTPVAVMMHLIFRDVVVSSNEVAPRLRALLLEKISQERQGQLVDRELIKATLRMLVDLGPDGRDVYEDFFEAPFLSATRSYYKQLSQDFLSQNTCPDYLRMATVKLKDEADRVSNYLPQTTDAKLKRVVEEELIASHAKRLIELEASGCLPMFQDSKVEDLRTMYNLFVRCPATLDLLRDFMSGYVKQQGAAIMADQESNKDSVVFVRQVLDLKSKMDAIIEQSFRNEKKAQKKLKEAFEEFANKDARCSSHLALYVDDLLKSGLRESTEAEAEVHLDRVIVIFRYLTDKDIFESFYKTHLSKRLLGGKSVSDELEKSMIAKLRLECGYQFTSKLEGMFQDMNLSKTVQEAFRDSVHHARCSFDLDVSSLSQGFWPLPNAKPNPRLPKVVEECMSVYQAFYTGKYDGRKLNWFPHLGTADVKATFPHGKHELCVSTYQMTALMAFNENQQLSFQALLIHCGVEDPKELQSHILGLCSSKLKILVREGTGKNLNADDVFSVNDDFKSKFKRIKVPIVTIKESSASGSADGGGGHGGGSDGGDGSGAGVGGGVGAGLVPSGVEEERKHITEAAIVRVMKTRKTLSHNDLVAEVTRQLSSRFAPQPPFIKKRIESLIERDYLQRDRDDARIYTYVA